MVENTNTLRAPLHSLIGDFTDALKEIENAWDARDTTNAKIRLQRAGEKADECMTALRGLL